VNCLVTGAGGFLGLYIVEQLVARGDRVRALCRRPHADLDRLGVETVRADLRDADEAAAACGGIHTVFHVAGVAGIWGTWDHFYGNNTLATRHVIAGCRRHGVSRLVYTSSPSVTFDGGDQRGVDETTPYSKRWLCHYPHTKALAEQDVLAANGRDGLWTCALRPHLIWGPRDRHLVPRLIERARRGQLRRVGNGRNLIDMVYVENAATAHLQAAERLVAGSPVCGRAYFITQGEAVNCWQWIDELLTLSGLPRVKKSLPLSVAWTIGAALEAAHTLAGRTSEPRMTRFLAAQLGRSHFFSIERARRDFGYEPLISTADGMRLLASQPQRDSQGLP
jgi:nucleoside-diphosphate-sugar epimerase